MKKRANYFTLVPKLLLLILVLSIFVIAVTEKTSEETKIMEEASPNVEELSCVFNILEDDTASETSQMQDENQPVGEIVNGVHVSELNKIKITSPDLTESEFKTQSEELQYEIMEASNNFVEDFVDKETLENNFVFDGAIIYTNPKRTAAEYVVVYDYEIVSYRENGKKTISNYAIKVHLDQDGNVIDKNGPREWFSYLKERGV